MSSLSIVLKKTMRAIQLLRLVNPSSKKSNLGLGLKESSLSIVLKKTMRAILLLTLITLPLSSLASNHTENIESSDNPASPSSTNLASSPSSTQTQPNPLTKQQATEFADNIIIRGNKRTRDAYIRKIIRICALIDSSYEYLEDCLDENGSFNDIAIFENAFGQTEISLADQWSFFPVPIYFVSNNPEGGAQQTAGVTVVESNLGGRGGLLVSSYFRGITNPEDNFFLILSFPKLGYWGKYDLSFLSFYNNQRLRQNDLTKLSYLIQENSFLFVSSLSNQIRDFASLEFSLGFGTYSFFGSQIYNPSQRPQGRSRRDGSNPVDEVKYNLISPAFGYTLDFLSQENYYDKGVRFQQRFNLDFLDYQDRGGVGRNVLDARLSTSLYLGVPTTRNQVFQLYFDHKTRSESNAYGSYKIGGGTGTRGIDSDSLWTNDYASLSLQYQIPMYITRVSSGTFAPFVDAGYASRMPQPANRPDGHNVSGQDLTGWTSIGAAFYFYFSRVTFPALGFFVAYNPVFPNNLPTGGFAFGANF